MENAGDEDQVGQEPLSDQDDEEREQQAQEQIEKNEEEGAPQFPGDTGVAPEQGEEGDVDAEQVVDEDSDDDEEGDQQEK